MREREEREQINRDDERTEVMYIYTCSTYIINSKQAQRNKTQRFFFEECATKRLKRADIVTKVTTSTEAVNQRIFPFFFFFFFQ